MPDQPMPVWSVKFFPDLRSLTPTHLAYISRATEEEVAQRVREYIADNEEEAGRIEISRVILFPPILGDEPEYWLD
jgi:hypothetical protein